jgi:hypothetical protein
MNYKKAIAPRTMSAAEQGLSKKRMGVAALLDAMSLPGRALATGIGEYATSAGTLFAGDTLDWPTRKQAMLEALAQISGTEGMGPQEYQAEADIRNPLNMLFKGGAQGSLAYNPAERYAAGIPNTPEAMASDLNTAMFIGPSGISRLNKAMIQKYGEPVYNPYYRTQGDVKPKVLYVPENRVWDLNKSVIDNIPEDIRTIYPDIGNLKLENKDLKGNYGYYTPDNGWGKIDIDLQAIKNAGKKVSPIIYHELQHAVQSKENVIPTYDPSMTQQYLKQKNPLTNEHTAYLLDPAEIEAFSNEGRAEGGKTNYYDKNYTYPKTALGGDLKNTVNSLVSDPIKYGKIAKDKFKLTPVEYVQALEKARDLYKKGKVTNQDFINLGLIPEYGFK